MKKYMILAAVMLSALVASAQTTWTNDPQHSRLGFVVKHLMISEIDGRFADFNATVTTSKSDYSDAKITLTAKVASINTDIEAGCIHANFIIYVSGRGTYVQRNFRQKG